MKQKKNKSHDNKKIFSFFIISSSLLYIFTNVKTRNLFISFFFLQFGLSLYGQSLSLFLVTTFSYTTQNMGVLFVLISIVTIISMYIFQPFVTRYYKYYSQVKISLILIFLLLVLYASYVNITHNNMEEYRIVSLVTLLILYVFAPFVMLGFTNLFANSVNRLDQGKIMGGSGQVSSIAVITSGLLMGKLLVISYFLLLIMTVVSLMLSYIILQSYLKYSFVNSDYKVDKK